MLEKDIEKILVREVKIAGGLAYKFISPGNDGVPDRIVILPDGRVMFVELKTDRGKLTALQQMQIDRIRARGAYACVVRGLSGLTWFFEWCGLEEAAHRVAEIEKRSR